MPFDALVRSPLTLADAASDLGITPIPAEVLAEHKRTEQAKYPPASFGYHHLKALRMGIGVATVITMVLILIGTVGFMRGDHYSSLWGLATLPFVLAIWASAKVMRGPAIWVECRAGIRSYRGPPTDLDDGVSLDAPDARVAYRDRRVAPGQRRARSVSAGAHSDRRGLYRYLGWP